MKNFKNKIIYVIIFITVIMISNCKKDSTVSDIDQTAALRNVTVTFDSISFQINLPAGALSGKSFTQLMADDPATYKNLANYSINFSNNYTASNKKPNASDAKFDGMNVAVIMDTITTSPINASTSAFEVKKNTSIPVQLKSSINLATHKRAGVYIFKQVVAGNDLVTTQNIALNYKIGLLQGQIDLPAFHENIPTRASPQMKTFLKGLLESGLLN